VFEAFVQQPQTLARSQGGLGLGLSIVKGLVEAHGGTVSAHSDGPGRGSTFAIELPAGESPRDGAGITRLETALGPSVASKRILVVDDNRDVARALEAAFGVLGHEVEVAHDGPSALALAETFKPELGFLDIGLPGMDGYELAAALRAAHDVRLVAITGYGQDRDRQRSREVGFEAHLVKPITLQQISLQLQRLDASGPKSPSRS
jgi:CheY-like chemotaxis protein